MILTCSLITCNEPASAYPLLWHRVLPLCNGCFDKWSKLAPGSDAERIFLAACDRVPDTVINDVASELLAGEVL